MSKEQPAYAAPDWKQINQTLFATDEDGLVRFSFNIVSASVPSGDLEQLLSMIVREHNSHAALVAAVRHALAIENSVTMGQEKELKAQAKAIYWRALEAATKGNA